MNMLIHMSIKHVPKTCRYTCAHRAASRDMPPNRTAHMSTHLCLQTSAESHYTNADAHVCTLAYSVSKSAHVKFFVMLRCLPYGILHVSSRNFLYRDCYTVPMTKILPGTFPSVSRPGTFCTNDENAANVAVPMTKNAQTPSVSRPGTFCARD